MQKNLDSLLAYYKETFGVIATYKASDEFSFKESMLATALKNQQRFLPAQQCVEFFTEHYYFSFKLNKEEETNEAFLNQLSHDSTLLEHFSNLLGQPMYFRAKPPSPTGIRPLKEILEEFSAKIVFTLECAIALSEAYQNSFFLPGEHTEENNKKILSLKGFTKEAASKINSASKFIYETLKKARNLHSKEVGVMLSMDFYTSSEKFKKEVMPLLEGRQFPLPLRAVHSLVLIYSAAQNFKTIFNIIPLLQASLIGREHIKETSNVLHEALIWAKAIYFYTASGEIYKTDFVSSETLENIICKYKDYFDITVVNHAKNIELYTNFDLSQTIVELFLLEYIKKRASSEKSLLTVKINNGGDGFIISFLGEYLLKECKIFLQIFKKHCIIKNNGKAIAVNL